MSVQDTSSFVLKGRVPTLAVGAPDMALKTASWGLTGGSYRPNSLSQPE
jgi:hypothetical protein